MTAFCMYFLCITSMALWMCWLAPCGLAQPVTCCQNSNQTRCVSVFANLEKWQSWITPPLSKLVHNSKNGIFFTSATSKMPACPMQVGTWCKYRNAMHENCATFHLIAMCPVGFFFGTLSFSNYSPQSAFFFAGQHYFELEVPEVSGKWEGAKKKTHRALRPVVWAYSVARALCVFGTFQPKWSEETSNYTVWSLNPSTFKVQYSLSSSAEPLTVALGKYQKLFSWWSQYA